ncbi:hypothetical protein ACFLSJ_01465 [Verrucomicrobiota bacterium]
MLLPLTVPVPVSVCVGHATTTDTVLPLTDPEMVATLSTEDDGTSRSVPIPDIELPDWVITIWNL